MTKFRLLLQQTLLPEEFEEYYTEFNQVNGIFTKMYGLADNAKREFIAGDVVRLADRGVHRLLNDGDVEIIYISVTSPPFNSGYAYKEKR